MHPDHFELEFFEDDSGREPCLEFLRGLEPPKRQALEQALLGILAREGLGVCGTEWGKHLGKGLSEFRVRHSESEIMRLLRPDLVDRYVKAGHILPDGGTKVLLRVFFHAHGDRIILLLGGYDKGRYSSGTRQAREIAEAHRLLKQFKQRQKAMGEPVPSTGFRSYWRDQRVYWRERWRSGNG